MIERIIGNQRKFFASGATHDIAFRKVQLKKLRQALLDYEHEILDALRSDLDKPEHEAYWSEIYYCLQEISIALKNLAGWAKPKRAATPWYLFPASSYVVQEPRGVVAIFVSWNYPFHLAIVPLIGALAAGNCAVIKPSEYAPNTSQLLAKIIKAIFDPAYVAVVEGGVEVAQALVAQKFDYIFFTGGTNTGKKVMQAAAQHLTPLTLELGGQNPCMVLSDAPLKSTAQRIVRGKFSNMGQSCIAPNYVLVHASVYDSLIEHLKKYIELWHGNHSRNQRLLNEHHFTKVRTFLDDCTILAGGVVDADRFYISPTLITGLEASHPALHDEVFGPILPILRYDSLEEMQAFINAQPKPLALYLFTNNKQWQQQVIEATSSGSVCINDVGAQFANLSLPFGGVGDSGFGAYHGKHSFVTFSHAKPVVKNKSWAISLTSLITRNVHPWVKKLTSWLVK